MVGTRILPCGKDTFYNFMKSDDIDWRRIILHVAKRMMGMFTISEDHDRRERPFCLIADDTDIEKTGRSIEGIGKIYSHVKNKLVLGFKALMLCWSDGKSQVVLDCSVKSEKGKKKDQGISRKDAESRYGRERAEGTCAKERYDEQYESKIDTLIEMIKRAIKSGVRFDYLLADSWFACAKLLKFILSRRIGCHFLGMIRINGKTKYEYEGKAMTATNIIKKIEKTAGGVKRNRAMKYTYAHADVTYQGMHLRLFFYKTGSRDGWHALITTDLGLEAKAAYKIYSMRWAIEVCFSDMKKLLSFGKNQCRDFSSLVGGVSISCIQYNIMSCVKRFESYETMGGLFGELYMSDHELSITERIWGLIEESLSVIASRFGCPMESLIELVIDETDNEALHDFIESARRMALLSA